MTVRHIGIAEVKRDFADVLGAVRHRGQRFVIQRRGTPVAALVPIADLQAVESLDEAGGGFLDLLHLDPAGAELAEVLDGVVAARGEATTRPAPSLPE